jgi:hypothetical protein
MTGNITIQTILVEEYVPIKREPIHPLIMTILSIILLYLYEVIIGMYE